MPRAQEGLAVHGGATYLLWALVQQLRLHPGVPASARHHFCGSPLPSALSLVVVKNKSVLCDSSSSAG